MRNIDIARVNKDFILNCKLRYWTRTRTGHINIRVLAKIIKKSECHCNDLLYENNENADDVHYFIKKIYFSRYDKIVKFSRILSRLSKYTNGVKSRRKKRNNNIPKPDDDEKGGVWPPLGIMIFKSNDKKIYKSRRGHKRR